ncbi:hypothetical protein GCM10022276_22860 [Sphingomonas limnosediminicola]|uniref:Uncharacterized protein n=1 Tax=Sphingomonas limnosediminicola TaxID=940133 RepID=A0ABP7LKE5_9SPHN
MMMTTIVAVALGFAPVTQDGSVQPASDNYSNIVGRYSQTIERDGKTLLRGSNRVTGAHYELTVDPAGRVEGTVGDWYVTFQAKDAA